MLKPFDWINVSPLCFCARNFVAKIAQSTPVLRYKPSGGGRDSCSPLVTLYEMDNVFNLLGTNAFQVKAENERST